MPIVTKEWKWRVRFSGKPLSVKELIANQLRIIADKLDKRVTFAVDITSSPSLTNREKIDCITHAQIVLEKSIDRSVKDKAVEELFRQERPELHD